MKRKKIPTKLFDHPDVAMIAQSLLGKVVETRINGMVTSGRIVEVEAYCSTGDKASHSYGGKRTLRNEPMYGRPGTVYVYICYGIHRMLNFVTNQTGTADALLISAIEPMQGIEFMMQRSNKTALTSSLTKGPGNVAKALGIEKIHSGEIIHQQSIFLYEDDQSLISSDKIGVSARIGVEGAGEDALLPYRFYLKGNKYVSGKPNK